MTGVDPVHQAALVYQAPLLPGLIGASVCKTSLVDSFNR
jgi:hypothetical protein